MKIIEEKLGHLRSITYLYDIINDKKMTQERYLNENFLAGGMLQAAAMRLLNEIDTNYDYPFGPGPRKVNNKKVAKARKKNRSARKARKNN